MILSTYSGLIWFLQKKTLFYIYIFISIWTFEIEQFRFGPQYEIYLTEDLFEDETRDMATYDIEIKAEQ